MSEEPPLWAPKIDRGRMCRRTTTYTRRKSEALSVSLNFACHLIHALEREL
jgi:hypothetical protein